MRGGQGGKRGRRGGQRRRGGSRQRRGRSGRSRRRRGGRAGGAKVEGRVRNLHAKDRWGEIVDRRSDG